MKRSRFFLILLVLALLGVDPFRGSILCFSDEGHHGVELFAGCGLGSSATSCNDEQSPCVECDDNPFSNGCTDIPLLSELPPPRHNLKEILHSHLSGAVTPLTQTTSPFPEAGRLAANARPIDPLYLENQLLRLTSVVLRV